MSFWPHKYKKKKLFLKTGEFCERYIVKYTNFRKIWQAVSVKSRVACRQFQLSRTRGYREVHSAGGDRGCQGVPEGAGGHKCQVLQARWFNLRNRQ